MELDELFKHIDARAANFLRLYPAYDKSVTNKVINTLKAKIQERHPCRALSKEDVAAIQNSLIIRNNPNSNRTRLYWASFNDFRFELAADELINYPPITFRSKFSRQLILNSHDQLLDDVIPVQIMHDHLLKFPSFTYDPQHGNDYIKQEAIEYLCSFITASLLYAKVSFPDFRRTLASMTVKDASISPSFINLRFDQSATYFRYFLPLPASVYFHRCVLFFVNEHRRTYGRKSRRADDPIFQPLINSDGRILLDPAKDIMPLYSRWLRDKLSIYKYETRDLRVDSFRKASVAWSVLSSVSGSSTVLQIPSVSLPVASRRIKSYSYPNRYLFHICPETKKIQVASSTARKIVKRAQFEFNPILLPFITEISRIYNDLNKRNASFSKRVKAANDIMSLVNTSAQEIQENQEEAFFNISLYAGWVCSLLKDISYKKISTLKNYFPIPLKIISIAADEEMKISDYSSEALTHIASTIPNHNTAIFKTGFTLFRDYANRSSSIATISTDARGLSIKRIPPLKPFIDFDDINLALQACDVVYPPSPPEPNPYAQFSPSIAETYYSKSSTLKIVIQLAFYTGLRIEEITDLKVGNVFHDQGVQLAIRGDRKTRNSIRNIPLYLLAPERFIDEFNEYFYTRRHDPLTASDKLFLWTDDSSNHNLDRKQTSKDVKKIFDSIGLVDFKFHYLRHAFASWFILRWYTAFHQIPEDTPFLRYELFQKPYLQKLSLLLLGRGPQRKGQDTFTYALAALARLMGHGGPIATLESYIHVIDWITYLAIKEGWNQSSLKVGIKQLSSFCQVTDKTSRNIIRKNDHDLTNISASQMLQYQIAYLQDLNKPHLY